MSINPRLNYSVYEPDAPRPQPLFWKRYRRRLDIAIFLLAVLAVMVLAIDDLAMISTMMLSIIFIPIVVPMLFAVPVAAAVVPLRFAYGILRHRFDIRMSIAIAIPFAALCVSAIDSALKYGPDGRSAAQHIVADQPALQPVTVPDHGIIAFRYDGPRWQWTDCPTVCQTLLTEGIATRVVNIGWDDVPFQAFYLADSAGTCAAQDKLMRRSDTICEAKDAIERTELQFDLTYEEAGPDQRGLNAIYHVTVHSGAFVQRSMMVSAQMPTGGGLLAPYTAGSASDGYFARQRDVRIVPDRMAELHASHTWDEGMKAGLGALVLNLVR